ncbi:MULTISPECIES: FG-GAP repeat domain-containing protein [unclassified Streptomyces]|uniref:FG-GAP repeat domain-containing protein n=1 Tax=unclassified Streptomyces TaxID=2593676 RepID=UPI0011B93629|nr:MULTISPECIES: VCBS repeat-containing protein [unclassified Streptomyces]
MSRRRGVRPHRWVGASTAVVASLGLATGFLSSPAWATTADTAQETVVPATQRTTYQSASLHYAGTQTGSDGAGAQGVFHRLEGYRGLVWTRYADGTTLPVPPAPEAGARQPGTGSDVFAQVAKDGRVELWDAVENTTRVVQIPSGLQLLSIHGSTVVAFAPVLAEDGTSTRVHHLLTPGPDGTTRDVLVTGMPAGLKLSAVRAADAKSLLFFGHWNGTYRIVSVDRATGEVRNWTQPVPVSNSLVRISEDHVVLFHPNNPKLLILPRDDLTATPAELTVGCGGVSPADDLAVVGDWVVYRCGVTIQAKPLAGGAAVRVVFSAAHGLSSAPDGSAVVVGRANAESVYGILRLVPGADHGAPAVTTVKPLIKPPAEVRGLSLEQGRLVVADSGTGQRDAYLRTVAPSGTPEFGERSAFTDSGVRMAPCPDRDAGCSAIRGTADGRIAWLERDGASGYDRLRVAGPAPRALFERAVPAGGHITDVSGDYVLYEDGTRGYVYRLDDSGAPVTSPEGASALQDDVLLTAGTVPGSVTGIDLSTGKATATLTTDANCVPRELQSAGRWLYWNCGPDGGAGVYDRTAKKSVPVPPGEARLGDGFVVTHDRSAGRLTLTTVTDGKAAGRVIGALPDTGVSQRDVRWTVDEAGANAAYVDAEERVHLVPAGTPAQPLRLLGAAGNAGTVRATTLDVTPGTVTRLLLSKPSAGWTLTVRSSTTGAIVDTVHGGAARGALDVGWHGDDPSRSGDAFLPNGRYDWVLSVAPADGQGDPLHVTGRVALVGARPVWRDLVGDDGIGELLALNSSGLVYSYRGTGTGGLRARQATSGKLFPAGTLLVPFGDTNGDRCNDVLVRQGNELRAYRPGCDGIVSASSPSTLIGSGWAQYNVIVSPGDVNGDGINDLVARQTTTGDMYFYAGTSTHKLTPRVRIGTDWRLYTKIVGAGDLNGDGRGDLLAVDKSGALWRYYGKAAGAVTPRTKIASNWGAAYTTVVGAGDLTGDGRADIVARDGSGKLYRFSGTGAGTLSGPAEIGTSGWSAYAGLY